MKQFHPQTNREGVVDEEIYSGYRKPKVHSVGTNGDSISSKLNGKIDFEILKEMA